MNADLPASQAELRARVRDLEARLEESEETLEAIRRGDFDRVVVQVPAARGRSTRSKAPTGPTAC